MIKKKNTIHYNNLGLFHNSTHYWSHRWTHQKFFIRYYVSDILTESAILKYTQFRKNHGFLTFNLDDLSSLERFSNKRKTFVKQGNVYYVVAKVNYNTTDADTEKINENLDVFTPNQLVFDLRQTDSYDDEVRALYQELNSQLNYLI